MLKRKFIWIILLLTTVAIVLLADYLEPPLDEQCTGVGYLPANLPTQSIPALKVVVEPFFSRHQVYGIFKLSREKHPPGQPVILTVTGAGKYCEYTGNLGQNFDDIKVSSDYYLSRHYIRTRTSLWLSFQGLLKQLRQPHNWTLTYTE